MTAARMVVGGAVLAGVASALWLLTGAAGRASTTVSALPCQESLSPAAAERRVSEVFEGIVLDQWPHTGVFDGRVITRRFYRFYVVRSWRKQASPIAVLTQGWYEGAPNMRGTYRVFKRGGRYLVFAVFHDMPPGAFSTSCLPGAEGADIPDMAAQLGPPVTTFPEADRPRGAFWMPLARSALDWVRKLILKIDGAPKPSSAPTR